MPILSSTFSTLNSIFKNPHASTIHASLLRRIPRVPFIRERVELNDGDFIDIDWSRTGSNRLVVTLPGLEGKSNSLYSRAAIRYFNQRGWDALGINYRGCSGEPNRLLRGYHMGVSDDLEAIITHIRTSYSYQSIVLLGYSLGGNVVLKYLGEQGEALPSEIKASVSFSVPIDIEASNTRLKEWYNWHYLKWFMFPLNLKARRKKRQFPGKLETYRGFFMSHDFLYFDSHFTAPAHGFDSASDYWRNCSSKGVLRNIQVPSLIVNSRDDTFISSRCFPHEEAQTSPSLYLEITGHGGHCGFIRDWHEHSWWMEERAHRFLQEHTDLHSHQFH